MTDRTARGNRVGLAVTGFVLVAAGGYGLARSLGAFGAEPAGTVLYIPAVGAWVEGNSWVWLAVAALGVVLAILAARWLAVQFRSDRLNRLIADIDPTAGATRLAAGLTVLPANALTAAVGEEIRNYPGVRSVTAYLIGDPDQPELHAIITLAADADVPGIRRRIVSEAVAHARTTLDAPDMPTQVLVAVARPRRDRRHYI